MELAEKHNLAALLDHLAGILDPKRQAAIDMRHRRTLHWEPIDRLPVIVALPAPAELHFKPYPHGEVFQSPEKMLFNELVYAFQTSIAARNLLADDLPCTIRANLGTVIIASMFGAHIEQIGDNPPWVRHVSDSAQALESLPHHDPLDFSQGWCPRVVELYQYYASVLAEYPELKRFVHIVLPDLQGPFDTLELIAGSDVFAELYTNSDRIHSALDTIATAQIGLARHLEPYTDQASEQPSEPVTYQHATMIRGRILIRNDSVIMMSPKMYRDSVATFDERVLRELGSGGIHSCGKVEGHVPAFLELPSIRCLDLGQSEMNDSDRLYRLLQRRQIPLTRLKVARDDLVTGQIMQRFPTGVSLLYEAESVRDAQNVLDAYFRAASSQRKG